VAPGITLTCIEDSRQITETSLTSNHLHFLGYYIDDQTLEKLNGKLNIIPIVQSRTYLCVNQSSPVAALKEISAEEGMALVNTVSPISPIDTFRSDQLIFSSSNVYQHLDSVVQNGTVCTMPDILLPKLKAMYPDVVMIPFSDTPGSPCSIVYPSTYVLSEADEVLISFLKAYFQNLQLIAQQSG
jgi:DNA-binding transcriptional LysR family regulator